jgi:hypothetical protein
MLRRWDDWYVVLECEMMLSCGHLSVGASLKDLPQPREYASNTIRGQTSEWICLSAHVSLLMSHSSSDPQ